MDGEHAMPASRAREPSLACRHALGIQPSRAPFVRRRNEHRRHHCTGATMNDD